MRFVSRLKTLILMTCLVFVGQGFALDCATGTGWGDYLTQEATTGSDDYYEIDTPEKLAWISCKMKHDNNNFKTAKVKLTQSIDMQGNLGKVFIPIAAGTGTPPSFNGTFDGQGFTISNLYINSSEIKDKDSVSAFTAKPKNGDKAYAQNIAMFGIISTGAIIKNLTLKDVQIYASASAGTTGINDDKPISVGAFVGWASEGGSIENCVASGSIETSGKNSRVGGIVGNVKTMTISNCVSLVSVTASGETTNVGGIVGALRNGGTVNMSSCVYSGSGLYTVDGSIGAIAGSYESVKTISTEDLYYSEDYCENLEEGECSGIGTKPDDVTFNTNSADNLNSEEVVCNLNGGTWADESCTGAKTDAWSVGQSDISMNGSDGYKITFNANGGAFASGAKTSKILAKDATITADEIGVPTREGKQFAGWATKADTTEPSPSLGVAHAATTVYAVWYDFYTVSFETNPETHTKETVLVPKHGTVSVEGFTVPATYTVADPQNPGTSIKYYFTGWGPESKMLEADVDPTADDTIHLADIDVVKNEELYAVWTKAKTFSVTFDATLHGKTDVRLVKIVNEGDPVSKPNSDDFITDAGYKVAGWCEDENCTEENEYDFSRSLEGNLTLYARWNVVQFNIEYVLFNGTNGNNPSSYTIEDADIVLADPTKTGSVFEGWFYDDAFTNPANKIDAGSTGDKTVYAKWKQITYTIQYLSGNTIYATAKNVTKNHGETIQLNGALDEFAHGGCTQDGWSKVDYGQEGYGVDYALGADYEDNANLKIFPHWTCNTYNVAYNLLGGEGIAVNHKDNPSEYTGPAKLTLKIASDSENRIFMDNWYKESTFKTAIRDIQNIEADLTVYARWYNKITYKPGNNVSGAKDLVEKKDLGKTYTFKSSIDKYVRENYTLDGWSTTDGGEKVYELGEIYTTNGNLTLYPHWVENRDSVQSGAVKVYTYATDGRKEAVIDGAYTGEGTIDFTTDVSVSSVEFTREFVPNTMSTLMLPFSIDTSKVQGGKIYRFKRVDVNEETGIWKVIIGRIYTEQVGANTPYLVLPTADKLTFEGPVTFNTATAPIENAYGLEEESTWEFKGVYAHTDFDDVQENGPMYAFAGQNKDGAKVGQFKKIGTGVKAFPMQAYLVDHDGITLAKSATGSFGHNISLPDVIDIEIEDENGIVVETGKLNTVAGEVRMDRWFDLKGRKLNSKPTVKGTYYKNGKKVIIK